MNIWLKLAPVSSIFDTIHYLILSKFSLSMTSSYRQQLQAKIERITTQFSEFTPPTLEVFESPEQHFRMRAEFRIWHTENDMFYAMFERNDDDKQNRCTH